MAGLQGRVFAGYQLAALIGAGGIAQVYRGRAQAGGREVAVKIIHADFAREPGFQARFQQSVQAASRLGAHPHILPLLASGEEYGHHYLVTPLVTDGTLHDWLRGGGRLGVDDVAPFFRQLANGLTYAHSLGITHGNLKPANVFLFEGRHVLLGDFGLLWDITQLDMQQPGPGTEAIEFFAPEAFGGRSAQPSDIYGMGAMLFATLTGHAPFRGQTPADVYAGHAHKPVPPLVQFDPTLPPALRALDPLIAQAMAKRPEDRLPSATLLAQMVETTLQQAGGNAPQSLAAGAWAGGGAASQFPPGFGAAGGASRFPVPGIGGIGGVPGGLGGSAPMGAPLQPLNFPPLPSSEGADGLMEQGRIAANWNDASAQQTQRGPFPAGAMPPGLMAPPPGQMMPGQMMPGQMMPGPILPPTPMNGGMPYPAAPAPLTTGRPLGMPPGLPPALVNVAPGLGLIPLPGANMFGTAGPLTQLPDEAPREVKGYSATELGLPRLTAADMGGLAPEVEQQMMAEIAGDEADSASAAVPAAEGDGEWDESRSYTAARSRYSDSDEDSRESQAFSAAYTAPRSEWDYSEELSAALSARRPAPRRVPARGRERWDEGESVEMAQPRSRRGSRRGSRRSSRRDEDEYERGYRDDPGYDRRASRGRRRDYDEYEQDYPTDAGGQVWLRPLLLTMIPLLLVSLVGVALLKPELCPTSACASLSAKLQHLVGMGDDANAAPPPAPVSVSPAQIQLSTTVGTAVSTPLKLSNTSTANIDWKATVDLPWVTFTPANGTIAVGGSATVTIQAKPTAIAPGTYTSNVVVTVGATTVKAPLQVTVAASG